MRRLNVAVIGQGRSGRDIHCRYFLTEDNKHYDVKYIVDAMPERQKIAQDMFPNATILGDYKDLFRFKDIDLVVLSLPSFLHFPVGKDLLEHKFNVLIEKPMAKTEAECQALIDLAKNNNCKLAVFQQSQYAPYVCHMREVIKSGVLGKIFQIQFRWNNFSRRWDWQTLQKNVGGNVYNTGPHPIGIALDLIGYDKDAKVVYSTLATTSNSSGDSDDYARFIIQAPNKPVIDIEINSINMYQEYFVQIVGERGNFITNINGYKLKYYCEEENPKKELVQGPLMDKDFNPLYCNEEMKFHEESGSYNGTAFDVGTAGLYEDLYHYITENRKMIVNAEMGKEVIRICEAIHNNNPLEKKI